jgi:hypothetical protein
MKTNILKIGGVCLITALLILTGCFSAFEPSDSDTVGKGTVCLSVGGGQARTVFPAAMDAFSYDLAFTASGKTTVTETLSGKTGNVMLEAGTWNLAVTAKHGGATVGTASVTGINVSAEGTTPVSVRIVPLTGGGAANGTLAWSADFNTAVVTSAKLFVGKLNETPNHEINLLDSSITTNDMVRSGTVLLAPGSWLVRAELAGGTGLKAGYSEIVHIYPDLPTALGWQFKDADLVDTKQVTVSVDVAAVMAEIKEVTLSGHSFHDAQMVKGTGSTWTASVNIPEDDTTLDNVYLTIETNNNDTLQTSAAAVTIAGNNAALTAVRVWALYGNITNGTVKVNGVEKNGQFQVDLLDGASVALEAVAASGYVFTSLMGNANATRNLTVSADTSVTAVFTVASVQPGTQDSLAGKLLILQAYGSSSDAAGISHSFVELYNNTNTEIPLSGITMYYADGTRGLPKQDKDEDWKTIALTGSIPAKTSYLILGPKQNTTGRYQIPENSGNINNSGFTLGNRSFKVALIRNTNPLIAQNPFNMGSGAKAAGYIDMVGAANDPTHATNPDQILGFETAAARNSASVSVRRLSLNDTDNNSVDFESADYRTSGMTAEVLEVKRPKNIAYGEWDPFAAPEPPVPPVSTGNTLLIFQVGAAGNTNNVSHSFVELYNAGTETVNLSTYSIQFATGVSTSAGADGAWTRINLTGSIPPRTSYLILGENRNTTGTAKLNFTNNSGDVNNSIRISNDAAKVVLMSNQTTLTVQNPFNTDGNGTKAPGYVDMVGGQNTYFIHGYETASGGTLTAQQTLRRTSIVDTDNNASDFESVHYGNATDAVIALKRPRSLSAGAWNPITGVKE